MKLVFLTNCLEPGQDGVGDYTALLAAECTRRGHACACLAFNDRSAESEGNLLRLASSTPWAVRVTRARDFVESFDPDFVSVQLVCYGFHPRGLAFGLPRALGAICGGRRVQIMFHELWIGAENKAPLTQLITGFLQRRIILAAVKRLQPSLVHTSNGAYLHLLARHGLLAERLPLFGNVPTITGTFPDKRRKGVWRFVMFGALHPIWPPEPLLTRLRELPGQKIITHVGRIAAGASLWEHLAQRYADGFEWRRLGQRSNEELARLFAEQDFGIATTPWDLLGKSGSVSALLNHGLPVIVNRDEIHHDGWREPGWTPQLIRMDEDLPRALAAAQRLAPEWSLPAVADQFLADLIAKASRTRG